MFGALPEIIALKSHALRRNQEIHERIAAQRTENTQLRNR
jgi:hypothetical protein